MTYETLFQPVISDNERAMLLMHMARVAYQEWAEYGGIKPDWEALSVDEKERWVRVVRISTRAMLSLWGHVLEVRTKAA
jgi:hypothetical protein